MIRTIRTAVLILLTALLAASALAQDSAESPSNQEQFEEDVNGIIQNIPSWKEDYALAWFHRLFGNIAFNMWDGEYGATLLSEAIGFTNIVAMVLGCVIVGWVYLSAVLRTAHEGEVMGKQWSTLWLPLRTAISFGLIVPVGALSIIQILVLSLIVVGSSAGSYLWNFVGERITHGTEVMATPGVVGTAPAKRLFTSLVCAQSVYVYQKNAGDKGEIVVARIRTADSSDVTPVHGPLLEANFALPANATSIEFGNNEYQCGEISFGGEAGSWLAPDPGEVYRDYHKLAIKQGNIAARQQLSKLLNSLGPLAHALVADADSGGLGGAGELRAEMNDGTQSFSEISEKHAKLLKIYQDAVERFLEDFPTAIAKASTQDPRIAKAWKDEVTKGGWGNAGTWFFDLTRFQALNRSIMDKVLGSISEPTPPQFCGWIGELWDTTSCEDYTELAAADMAYGVDAFHSAALENLSAGKNGVAAAIAALAEVEKAGSEKEGSSGEKGLDKLSSALIAQVMLQITANVGDVSTDGMTGEVSVSDTDGMASPFRTVAAIGESLNNVAGLAWGMGLAMSMAGEAADSVSWVPVAGTAAATAKGATDWLGTTVIAIIMVLVPMGFVLAFLIPFLPVIAWVRLIAAYLLTAIEAVVAAPLAVIMMATPEGEGIVGTRLERAIQLMAAIILKPTLMVIGLVAALSLGYVTFSVLNALFWKSAANVTDSMGPFEVMAILLIYVGSAFQVAKASVMVMHKLPDQILDWMAGGVGGRSFGDDAEQSIQGSMEQSKGSMSSVAGSLSQHIGGKQARLRSNRASSAADESRGPSGE